MQTFFFVAGRANLSFHNSVKYFTAESDLLNYVTAFKSLL